MTRSRTDVAVIGAACRLPGAADPEALWGVLREGRCAISEVPASRWDAAALYDPDLLAPDALATRWGGFVDDLESFDAAFFGVSPGEAAAMDPQQRLVLEVAWEALERAGRSPASLAGSATAVFVAAGGDDSDRVYAATGTPPSAYHVGGHSLCFLANRLSRLLDLRGPSVTLDTGCSGSLVAIHLACQSLHARESDLALAGAAHVMLSPFGTAALSRAWVMAPDGRCKSFDASADGYVRAEGCGAVVLKRLDDALADGDPILGVIRASAVSQDGRTQSLTAPSAAAQEALVRRVLALAGLSPSQIDYVEAHGVGTPAADAAEAAALAAVFGGTRPRPLPVGSVKTNLGHLEPAAGMAALLKVLLCLRHETLAPSLHFRAPRAELGRGLEVVTAPTPWRPADAPRRAGVSSFGIGGANAHLIVEEAPPRALGNAASDGPFVLPLSARTPAALRALAGRFAEHLDRSAEPLRDVCYTAAVGRAHLGRRAAFVARHRAELRDALRAFAAGQPAPPPEGALGALAARYIAGDALDLSALPNIADARRVELPTYPFQRERHWPDFAAAPTRRPRWALAGAREALPGGALVYTTRVGVAHQPYLADHRVDGRVVVDCSMYLAALLAVAAERWPGQWVTIADAELPRALAVADDEEASLRITLAPQPDGSYRFEAASAPAIGADRPWTARALGSLRLCREAPGDPPAAPSFDDAARVMDAAGVLDEVRAIGMEPGPRWQAVRRARYDDRDAVLDVELPPGTSAGEAPAHPVLLGCCFVPGMLFGAASRDGAMCFPSAIEALRWYRPPTGGLRCVAARRERGDGAVTVDVVLYDDEGVVAAGDGLTLRRGARALVHATVAGPGPVDGGGARAARGAASLGALPERERREAAVALVRELVAARLGPAGVLPDEVPLREAGLDSVGAVELRNALARAIGLPLPATLVFDHPTVAALADAIVRRVAGPAVARAPSPASPALTPREEPIAIVGMACRFPGGADSPERFWELLARGGDAVTEVPRDRWDVDAFYDPAGDEPGRMTTRWGAFVPDLDRFDPGFFGLSTAEAAATDPQHRLLMEVAWEALEDAGVAPGAIAGTSAGVFVGIATSDHYKLLRGAPARAGVGVANSVAANRLSYFFDVHGPSVAVDTACSSALVALSLACDSLRSGEADLAFAGGVNAILAPDITVAFSGAGMMSPDGRCRTFDAGANGYVRGEGCGLVLLKRLSEALAAGDRIRGVIRAASVNTNGRTNGLTAPSARAQRALIERTAARAGVDPARVGYVEAHGTGTPLGDPIEVEALRATYGAPRPDGAPCALGSVKTNVGHLEAAAGVAGLIKAVLCLEREAIPPHLHFESLNPDISFEGTPFVVPTRLTPWPRGGAPRFAAVSSFGFGGANAHVLLEEAPTDRVVDAPAASEHLLTLSARSDAALRRLAARYVESLARAGDEALADVAFTANTGRAVFRHRLAVRCRTIAGLRDSLDRFARGAEAPEVLVGDGPRRDGPSNDRAPSLELVARAFVDGFDVDLAGVAGVGRRRVALPTYPFERVDLDAAELRARRAPEEMLP